MSTNPEKITQHKIGIRFTRSLGTRSALGWPGSEAVSFQLPALACTACSSSLRRMQQLHPRPSAASSLKLLEPQLLPNFECVAVRGAFVTKPQAACNL